MKVLFIILVLFFICYISILTALGLLRSKLELADFLYVMLFTIMLPFLIVGSLCVTIVAATFSLFEHIDESFNG